MQAGGGDLDLRGMILGTVGEGWAPIQWDRNPGVQFCAPLCDDVYVPVFVCMGVLMHSPLAAMGMSSCPRRAPTCSLPGLGRWLYLAGLGCRVGSLPLGLSYPLLTMPGHAWGPEG